MNYDHFSHYADTFLPRKRKPSLLRKYVFKHLENLTSDLLTFYLQANYSWYFFTSLYGPKICFMTREK